MTITDDDGVEVTIAQEPERIVTFAPSMTEIVFALGLGDRLVGVSGPFDDYPAEAKDVEEVGGAGDFGVDPTIEKVVSLEPDLFLTIPGGDQWKQRLRDLDIPVVDAARGHLDDLLGDIETIGELTGAVRRRSCSREQMSAEADAIARTPRRWARSRASSRSTTRPLTTVGPNTFIFDLLGARRVRSGDRGSEDRLPGVVGRRARRRRSRGVPRDAGVGEERRGRVEAARVRRDPARSRTTGSCSSTATSSRAPGRG